MSPLQPILQDILWFRSLPRAVQIGVSIFVIAGIVGACALGKAWWTRPVIFIANGMARETVRAEVGGVLLGIAVLLYLISVIDRARRGR